MNLTLQITQLNVGKVNILADVMGTLSGFAVKLEINNGFRLARPIINRLLESKPIQFPTQVLGLFKLEAITLSYFDDYLYAGVTPIFIGPTITHSVYEPIKYDDDGIYFMECIESESFEILEDGTEYLKISSYDLVYEIEFEEGSDDSWLTGEDILFESEEFSTFFIDDEMMFDYTMDVLPGDYAEIEFDFILFEDENVNEDLDLELSYFDEASADVLFD